jgi:DNA-binding CsgD family transcriptional regulator
LGGCATEGGLLLAAVEAIYGSAAQPSSWPSALQAITDVFDDVGTVLLWSRDDGGYGTIVSPKLAAAQAEFQEKWWRHDIRSARGLEHAYLTTRLEACTDRHIVTPEEIETHPIYTQFLVPHGLGWFAAISISPDPSIHVWISVQRAKAKTPYTDDELETLTRLARHAERSLRLGVRLFDAELAQLGLADALARVGIGVFALDSLQRVMFSNPAADALLGDGLRLVNGRLAVAGQRERRALDAAIEKTSRAASTDNAAPLLIHRERSDRPLALYVLPIADGALDNAAARFLTSARAIVLVIDPTTEVSIDPALVRDLMGLTLGEARLAALVGTGLAPRTAAEKLGISEHTARTVLKNVYAKTGVSRQSELAVLLTKLALR